MQKAGKLKKPNAVVKQEDCPPLLTKGLWIWGAFLMLGGQRDYNDNGPQPIKLSDISAWAEINQINPYDQPFLAEVLCEMDRKWLVNQYELIRKEREKKSAKGKGGGQQGLGRRR